MPDDDGLLLSRCLSLDLEVGKQDRRIQGHLLRPSDSSRVFNIVPGIGRVFPLTPFFSHREAAVLSNCSNLCMSLLRPDWRRSEW